MAQAALHVGTSGYAYPAWKGAFYPEKLAQARFLEFYATQFDTVEINNTFYRFPGEKMLATWQATTPEHFRFAVKSNQRITHLGRLKNVGDVLRDFAVRCHVLGDKLGPILLQLPPNLKRDDGLLADFLADLPAGTRFTMEFRHATWFDDAVFEQLRAAHVALCLSEGEKIEPPRTVTTDFTYIRLRRDAYTPAELAAWRTWCEEQCRSGVTVYAYLKHDDGASPAEVLQPLR